MNEFLRAAKRIAAGFGAACARPLARLWPSAAARRRAIQRLRSAPRWVQVSLVVALIATTWICSNWLYQVAHKPVELLYALGRGTFKTPPDTWKSYQALFRSHSTPTISAELLAALAQIESNGNPMARTYWSWRVSANPFGLYRPASTAVGMYQLTDGTFREMKRYCIHDHRVVEDGPWHDVDSCWFNALYTRLLPSDAVELTAAFLDRKVNGALIAKKISSATVQQKQNLAATIHLCGVSAGHRYAANRFRTRSGQRCGDHSLRLYLRSVDKMTKLFAQIARDAEARE
jgi:hypothetical protein